MRTTIRDVAEAVGVSAMAVSAVLNGAGTNVKVSDEKALLIRKIAKDLNYRRNNLARSLRNQRTSMIAVVFQHFDGLRDEHPYYPQLLNGVMAALFPAGYSLALCPGLILGSDAASISDGRFDGVLWCRPDLDDDSLAALSSATVPVVMMHAPPETVPGVPTFCADNGAAMRTVVAHLVELGHSKLAFVVDPVNAHTVEGRARREAFTVACEEFDLAPDVLIWEEACPEFEDYRMRGLPHSALVCFSDTVAGGVLTACRRVGVGVPGQLSVVGFDSSPFCEGTRPRLTSVNQPVERMAFAATNHLLSLIRDEREDLTPSPAASSIYECGLDIRESTSRLLKAESFYEK